MRNIALYLTYLGTAYGKTYTQTECEIHYDFLGAYNFNTFVKAIKGLIKQTRYLPRINELIDECEKCKHNERIKVIECAKANNIITGEEYDKIYNLVLAGYIPPAYESKFNTAYKQLGRTAIESNTRGQLCN